MKILGNTIQTNDITGISQLYFRKVGTGCYYNFFVLTRSGPVEVMSDIVEDFHIATKYEQAALNEFKNKYLFYEKMISQMLGEHDPIVEEYSRLAKLRYEYEVFCKTADAANALISKLKVKNKEEILTTLGQLWVSGKTLNELSV